MTEQYTQTVDVAVGGRAKRTQWIGIASLLISLGFVVVAGFYNWFFLFGFALFAIIGVLDMHFYNATAKEYIYNYDPVRLVIAKKDVVNRTRRVLNLRFEDALSFAPLDGTADDGDIVCCSSPCDEGVCELTFKVDGETRRVLIRPDEYLTELILKSMERAGSETKE